MSLGLKWVWKYLQSSLTQRLRIFWTRFCTNGLKHLESPCIQHQTIWEEIQLNTASILIVKINASDTVLIKLASIGAAISSRRGIALSLGKKLILTSIDSTNSWDDLSFSRLVVSDFIGSNCLLVNSLECAMSIALSSVRVFCRGSLPFVTLSIKSMTNLD